MGIMLTDRGYQTVIPKLLGGRQLYIYPAKVDVSFNGSALLEPFYAEEKRYLSEIVTEFEYVYGSLPENTWYMLFWDEQHKISGIGVVAVGFPPPDFAVTSSQERDSS